MIHTYLLGTTIVLIDKLTRYSANCRKMIVQKKELLILLKPYYWVNIILTCSYVFCKKCEIICNILFVQNENSCQLDTRELEILIFLMIVVMIRTRKAGSVTMINYLSSSFIYSKSANILLWFYADVRYGLFFTAFVIVLSFILPEPTYSGPENVIYFRSLSSLEDALKENKQQTVWLICFYTVWNPTCAHFAPIFSKLSVEYDSKNLKFGKIDISRYPDVSQKYSVSDSSLSRQLPTVILFKNGKEVLRRPTFDSKGKVYKFFFTEANFRAAFDLNNVFNQCKLLEKKKFSEISEKSKTKNKEKTH
ncbi:thioredoxin-related transmembrane protein 2 homolog [Daktulosphaira vitifoliae]|uniref:thioredoxin-related transmembrane protein 2 homolog n=1 Tax=Daktulosphaira vitifoliae TaxID=58002 RepID=UPI0021AA8E48|nr:thioredoxin-related transmembrane protein 2 homolog [Daktulosphaira vitifoliae]